MELKEPIKKQDTASGSSKEWDAIWKKIEKNGNSHANVFTRSTPRTIFQFWQRCYFEDLMLVVTPQPDWQFLELASGRGTTSLYLANHGFKNITLVDLSETALAQAMKNFASEKLPQPKTVHADAESTGLPGNRYDCIYNIGVLEHFEDPTKILAESLRLLRPGGIIFMPIVPDVPFSRSVLSRLILHPLSLPYILLQFLFCNGGKHKKSNMVRTSYGTDAYKRYAQEVGFECAQCQPYNPYWKLYSDGSRFEESIVIPLYRLHLAIKKSLGFSPRLKTWSSISNCLLLTATKPKLSV